MKILAGVAAVVVIAVGLLLLANLLTPLGPGE